MSKEELDSLFKNKLGTHQERPSADAWERLAGKLDKSPEGHRFKWWYAAAAILLLITAGIFIWTPETHSPVATHQTPAATGQDTTIREDIPVPTPEEPSIASAEPSTGNATGSPGTEDAPQKAPDVENKTTPPAPIPQKEQVAMEDTREQLVEPTPVEIKEPPITDSRIAAQTVSQEEIEQSLTFSIEEFDEALITDAAVTSVDSTKESGKKGLKKLWAAVKNGPDIDAGIAELREAKNDLLSFNRETTESHE